MSEKLLTATPDLRRKSLAAHGGVALFVAAIVLSAGLLFIVEPMFSKLLLPRFGGSASVWSVAIVFFQGALLVGYLYAHLVIRYLPGRAGQVLHLALLALAGAFLPLGVAEGWSTPPQDGESLYLLGLFTVSIGAPFAVLSASAPLLQAWFARSSLPGRHNPYPLYAASNIGSLGALLAYPFLIEPLATLRHQTAGWSMAYGCLFVLIGAVAIVSGRSRRTEHRAGVLTDPAEALQPVAVLRWIFLSLVPSAGLVAVTAHLSTDVAAAPFLWVIPLALYLLTFVIAFGGQTPQQLRGILTVLPFLLVGLSLVLALEFRTEHGLDGLLHLAVFFVLCLACHGVLAAGKPGSSQLTAFYLAMSVGGVVGGILAALVAPAVFSWVAEYPMVLVLGAFALPKRGAFLAAGLAAILVLGRLFPIGAHERETHRSFYGVHTIEVTKDGQFRTLRHGAEVHGAQRIADEHGQPVTGKPLPLTYYSEDSPISEAIDAARAHAGGRAIRIGVIGLGTGSIACLAEPADALTFFEIDPAVIAIARDATKFRFLSACAPKAKIIPGDARQTLASDAGGYDILIVDAFSSDSIPVHLLTREALAVYLEKIRPEGMIVLHISNNHLRLNEVVAATARGLGLAVRINDEDGESTAAPMVIQPTVAVLAHKDADFGQLARSDDWEVPPFHGKSRAWSDDYSNLIGAFIAKLKAD